MADIGLEPLKQILAHRQAVLRLHPLYHFLSGKPVQHEVLLRLLDNAGNEIPPQQFLPTAVQHKMLPELDMLTLHLMESQFDLFKKGLPTPVALNISSRSLEHPEYVRLLGSTPWRSFVPKIILELKAGDVLRGSQNFQALKLLQQLKIGVSMNYDSGGAEFVRMAQQLGCNYLKFDTRAFCLTFTEAQRREVVQAMQAARQAGIQVVFERVETDTDLATLRNSMPDLVQGYLFGWPQFGFTEAKHALLNRSAT